MVFTTAKYGDLAGISFLSCGIGSCSSPKSLKRSVFCLSSKERFKRLQPGRGLHFLLFLLARKQCAKPRVLLLGQRILDGHPQRPPCPSCWVFFFTYPKKKGSSRLPFDGMRTFKMCSQMIRTFLALGVRKPPPSNLKCTPRHAARQCRVYSMVRTTASCRRASCCRASAPSTSNSEPLPSSSEPASSSR